MDRNIFKGVEKGYEKWSKLPANKGKNFDAYVAEKNINSQFQNMSNTSTWDGVVTDPKAIKKTQEWFASAKGTIPLDARNIKGLTIGTAGLKNVPVNFVFPNGNKDDVTAAENEKVVIIGEGVDANGKKIAKKLYVSKNTNLSSGKVTNGGITYKIKSKYVPVVMPETGIINENFLVEKGILQFHKETETDTGTSEKTENYTRSYKLAGSDEVMTFNYNTAAPAHQHNNRGENYFTMSATIGNNKVILQSPSGENIPGSIGVREVQDYWQNNSENMHANNMIAKVGGFQNLELEGYIKGENEQIIPARISDGKVYITLPGKKPVEITGPDKNLVVRELLKAETKD